MLDRRRVVALAAAAVLASLAILVAPASAHAQAVAAADTVVAVEVSGNATVDGDLVRRSFGLSPGSRYSVDAVRRGIERLYDLGFFSDVAVEGEPAGGGISLLVRVVENPRVGAIEYSGNDHFNAKKLGEITGTLVGRMADERLLATVQRKVLAAYAKDGYTRASLRPRYLPGDSEARRILFVEVEEGPKVRVEAIRFLGNTRLEGGDLRGSMRQGTKGFLRGGVFRPEYLAEDKQRIEAEMAKRGFRDGEVLKQEAVPGSRDDRVVVEVTISEGPRYSVGAVRWEGNEALPDLALYGITRVSSGEVFNQEEVDRSVEDAYGLYAERGYIYLTIRPDYSAADSTVDLVFRVSEGEPSRVHDILITGNNRTKERVIRRQLAIRPGELFRRNALIRSQRELMQLGYFADMQLDSRPVPGSNDIDLLLNVEERQVGTASAGFGYSSSVGLTGFMELGHTNLFGNGQSINLRMERGSRRNNAELSLTEPWFLGTPTSLGIDLFSTNRILRDETGLDLEYRRAGGALRVGRPLFAYTRGYATYRLVNQKVIDESDIEQNSFYTIFRIDDASALSSGLTLQLIRNSTDHPIYPTVGSVSSVSAEFTGGPLGGDQVYQKYELDLRRYLKTLSLGGWNPVLMLRGRIGAVGSAFRDTPFLEGGYTLVDTTQIGGGAQQDSLSTFWGPTIPIPAPRHFVTYPQEVSEFFRLGGTTYDPLRGYDDFEIVPRENVGSRFVVRRVAVTDTSGGGVDTTGYRYPTTEILTPYPGGKFMFAYSTEWQFSIADPLHGLLFFDVGGTWNEMSDFRWDTLHRGVGFGLRMEVPLLGLIGFDYGYGYDRLNRSTGRYDASGWEPHIQFGRVF